ncbi:MAG: hypothetical protein H7Y27_08430 [Gemmatimonadaceae bacterium]|nr:hypothetical protein [Chitinophagaceae bacterium]
MTYRRTTVLFFCVIFCSMLHAQGLPINQHPVQKPLLFSSLPDKFSCSASFFEQLFVGQTGKPIVLKTGKELQLNGMIVERVQISGKQLSINFRCSNFQNALLNVSRITISDGNYRYTGRIVSPAHGDMLLLTEEDGIYSFLRKNGVLTLVE